MLQGTYDFIKKHGMVKQGDTVLIALSSGADSVALLYLMHELTGRLDIKLFAVHLNHGLRDNAKGDAKLARMHCDKLGIAIDIGFCDVRAKMKNEGLSLEVAARNARWDYIRSSAAKCGAGRIAVAHHLGDRAETMLLNLTRGSGLYGLCAMKPVSGDIIRPLLFAQKAEIIDFLNNRGIIWREDESNRNNSIPRNYIRNRVLKDLESINPSVIKSMNNMARLLSLDEDYLNDVVLKFESLFKREDEGVSISISSINNLHESILSRVLRLMAQKNNAHKNIQSVNILEAIKLISQSQVGSYINWPSGLRLYIESDRIWMGRKLEKNLDEIKLNIDGYTEFGNYEIQCSSVDKLPKNFRVETPKVQYMEGEMLLGCSIRTWRDGDVITPLGMKGHKLISDVLTDKKIPKRKKDAIILFVRDNLVHFIKDIGISEQASVKKSTKNIIRVEFSHKNS